MKMAHRLEAMGVPGYKGTTRKLESGRIVWTGKINLDIGKMWEATKTKKPTMFFVDSMSDLFHEKIPYQFIDEVWGIMISSHRHIYQILTKRENRLLEYSNIVMNTRGYKLGYSNIWIGVSVENKETKKRIDVLRKVHADVKILSIEPLLEDLGELNLTGINQVIVGSESGAGARSMAYTWVENIFNQCREQKVAFYMKQIVILGKKLAFKDFPEKIRIREFPMFTQKEW